MLLFPTRREIKFNCYPNFSSLSWKTYLIIYANLPVLPCVAIFLDKWLETRWPLVAGAGHRQCAKLTSILIPCSIFCSVTSESASSDSAPSDSARPRPGCPKWPLSGGISSVGRARAQHARGLGFDSQILQNPLGWGSDFVAERSKALC